MVKWKERAKIREPEETREWMQEEDRDEDKDYILFGYIFNDDD